MHLFSLVAFTLFLTLEMIGIFSVDKLDMIINARNKMKNKLSFLFM